MKEDEAKTSLPSLEGLGKTSTGLLPHEVTVVACSHETMSLWPSSCRFEHVDGEPEVATYTCNQATLEQWRVLDLCQKALRSLPADTLGRDPQGGWFYRDELLGHVERVLQTTTQAGNIRATQPTGLLVEREAFTKGLFRAIEILRHVPLSIGGNERDAWGAIREAIKGIEAEIPNAPTQETKSGEARHNPKDTVAGVGLNEPESAEEES